MKKKIQLLDDFTINKIAAGEVIENPKSIVKELVENSLDAKANEVIVEIKNGGKSYIRVTDNGIGINKEDVFIAFKRHSTSKITSVEDLFTINTLGFRGEALASIAAIAKVEIITKTDISDSGIKVIMENSKLIFKEDIGCPVGTTIIVTKLFYNVPARKKFLKSDNAEGTSVREIVANLALSREEISFTFMKNNSVIFKTPKNNDFFNTIASLFGKDLCESLIKINYINEGLTINGYTTNLNYYRGNRKYQLVFINDRYIKNKQINKVIEDTYKTLLPINKHPACFLKINIENNEIDVNVHPAKTEIRFNNTNKVMSEIKLAISNALRKSNLIKKVNKNTITPSFEKSVSDINIFKNTMEQSYIDNKPSIKKDETKDNAYKVKNDHYYNLDNNNDKIKSPLIKESINLSKVEVYSSPNKQIELIKENKDDIKNNIANLFIIGVLFNTYILCENLKDNEFFIIDQHAAHERINFEKFNTDFLNKKVISQELIAPEIIKLSYDDYSIFNDSLELFTDLGFIIENFGSNSIMIRSIPMIFIKSNINQLFYNFLDSIKAYANKSKTYNNERIIKEACTKSVKSGDKLHNSEIKKLLYDLSKTNTPFTCPHGRPVIIKMNKYEIEKMFERT